MSRLQWWIVIALVPVVLFVGFASARWCQAGRYELKMVQVRASILKDEPVTETNHLLCLLDTMTGRCWSYSKTHIILGEEAISTTDWNEMKPETKTRSLRPEGP